MIYVPHISMSVCYQYVSSKVLTVYIASCSSSLNVKVFLNGLIPWDPECADSASDFIEKLNHNIFVVSYWMLENHAGMVG